MLVPVWRAVATYGLGLLSAILLGCSHARGGVSLDREPPASAERGQQLTALEVRVPQRSPIELARRATALASIIAGRRCRWSEALGWARSSLDVQFHQAEPLRCDRRLELEYDRRFDVLQVRRRAAARPRSVLGGSRPRPDPPTVGIERARASVDRFFSDSFAASRLAAGTWRMIHTPAELPPELRRDGYLFVYARTYAGVRVIGSVLRIAVDHEGDIVGVMLADAELIAGGVRTAARSSAEACAMLEHELADEMGAAGPTVSIRSAELVYETGCPADRAAAAPVLYASTTFRSRGGLFSSDQRRTLSMVHPRPRPKHPRCTGGARLRR